MIPADTKATLPFVVIAALAWYASAGSVATWVSWSILVGIGIAVPVLITEFRSEASGS